MSDEILSVRSVLESCIQREVMSVALYDRAIAEIPKPDVQRLMGILREEEVTHQKLLTEALSAGKPSMLGQKIPPKVSTTVRPKKQIALEDVKTPKELIEYAISHEEKSIDYFSRYVDAFRGTNLGNLFERLRREEEAHRVKLLAEYEKINGK
jgi:rubrerythrin